MKRIINGVTYNTATSTALALKGWHEGAAQSRRESDWIATLYQTRSGAFFVVNREEYRVWNQTKAMHEVRETVTFEPLSPEEARRWIHEGSVEIIANPFADVSEAAADAEGGATIYVRVPALLKKRVEEKAAEAKVSGNQLVMRWLERCLELPPEQVDAMAQLLTAVKSQRSAVVADSAHLEQVAQALEHCEKLGL